MKIDRALGLIRILPIAAAAFLGADPAWAQPALPPPVPLAAQNEPHTWVLAFKLNGQTFPTPSVSTCLFGGTPQHKTASLQYALAQSDFSALVHGPGLIGTGLSDPVGATFNEIYNSALNFIVWNDQLYGHPAIAGCGTSCGGPWGHSKGVIAWDNLGNGLVMQVSTPSWPGSGTSRAPRVGSGNTLGCIATPNDILFSQHFFALKLTPTDTAAVLDALVNASVVTDVSNPELARIGGPPELQSRAALLGKRSGSTTISDVMLSSGIRLISKPSALHVPPWQMVSARLGGVGLRTATWWASPRIPTTAQSRKIACWRSDLGTPGRVEVALTGTWQAKSISLIGGGNHAKLGVSIDGTHPYVILGDLNQQGQLTNNCGSSQNGRGGVFYVLEDAQLHGNMIQLLAGNTAPTVIKNSHKKKVTK